MHSKEKSKEKIGKDEKKSREEVSLNPQKKRLEQLRQRKEQEDALKEKQAHSKSRSKPSKEVTTMAPGDAVKMSAEPVDCEYSAEDDNEDEEIKNAKNETLKKLLSDKKKLENSLRLAGENDKKLKSILEAAGQWFDKYDKMLDELDEQLTAYNASRKLTIDNIINIVKPLCERWKESRKTMQALKFGGIAMPSISFFGNLAHYGISILRQLLFAMAYCRDLVSTSSTSDSSRTVNSPSFLQASHEVNRDG